MMKSGSDCSNQSLCVAGRVKTVNYLRRARVHPFDKMINNIVHNISLSLS